MNRNNSSKWSITMVAAAVAGLCGIYPAAGAIDTFTNTNSNWDTATNWSLGAVPTATDTAEVGFISGSASTATIKSGDNLAAGSVVLGDGNNSDRGQIFFDGGTLTVGGGTGSITTGSGTADGWIIFQNDYNNTPSGYAATTINATTVNVDSVFIGQGTGGGEYIIPVGQSWSGGGSLVLGNANGNLNPGLGILTINGSASFPTVDVAVGAVNYTSDLTMSDVGILSAKTLTYGSLSSTSLAVSGFSTGQYSQIGGITGGTATFAGTLNLNLAGVTGPGSAQVFNFSNYSGTFGTVNVAGLASGLTASFDAANGTVTVSSVPEPAAMGLMAAAGVGLLLVGRKRKQA